VHKSSGPVASCALTEGPIREHHPLGKYGKTMGTGDSAITKDGNYPVRQGLIPSADGYGVAKIYRETRAKS
jgi:hypothetical protein